MTPTSESTPLVETKFGKSPPGSFGSYQLSTTEDNFKVYCDISSVPRRDPVCNQSERLTAFPRFPLKSGEPFVLPAGITEAEKTLLDRLQVDADKINEIERKTQRRSDCEEWRNERKFRFTASNFGLISNRKRHHDNFVNSLLHPKPFTSRYTDHGIKYEPVALEQYQKYSICCLSVDLYKC